MKKTTQVAVLLFLCFVFLSCSRTVVRAQQPTPAPKLTGEAKMAREYSLRMLDEMKEILGKYYYDAKFHGIDLKTRIEAAKTRVKTLQYNWQMYRVPVQVLMEFNDSHTFVIMPPRTDHFQYGVGWQMIGDECYVTSVKSDSDALKKGVEVGDQILLIGSLAPSRRDLWKIEYVLYRLDPEKTIGLKLKKPDGTEKAVTIEAKTLTEKEYQAEQKAKKEKRKDTEKYSPFKCQEVSKKVVACRLDTFMAERGDIDKMMKTVSTYPKMILDLRGNGGGKLLTEEYLLSYFFDREIKIAEMISKDKAEVRSTKVLDSSKRYAGELAVLVDSNSASASEITARVLQIEKRAKIYGDFSSGSVMASIPVPFRSLMSAISDAAIIRVGMSVTVADVVMRDGSRIEHVGVTPDEVLQPLGVSLKMKMDAVLSYVAVKFGAQFSPEQAGKFHFITEKDEDADETPDDK